MSITFSSDTHRYLGNAMQTEIYPTPALSGQYDLHPFQSLTLAGANAADVGMVRIGAGTRSPAELHATTALADTVVFYVLIDSGQRRE